MSSRCASADSRAATVLGLALAIGCSSNSRETKEQRRRSFWGFAEKPEEVLGILHPDAHYPLNINAFREIPFIKIQRWPIENREIQTERVLGQPSGRDFKHQLIASP